MDRNDDDAIVLVDREGEFYVLSRAALDAARVSPAARDALIGLIDGDTEGYARVPAPFFVERSMVVPRGVGLLSQYGIIVVGGRTSLPATGSPPSR